MRARLIHNPTAGQIWNPLDVAKIVAELLPRGWCIDMVITSRPGHASELAAQAAAEGIQVVLVAGGDGTINEAVQGLAGTQAILGIIPVGTTNVLAREMGVPLNLQGALEALHSGVVTTIDLGRINGRYFMLMAGIGYDAALTKEVDPTLKAYGGFLAYAAAGTKAFFAHQPTKAWITYNGEKVKRTINQIIVSNSRFYGASFNLAPQASMRDGLFDVTVFRRKRFGDAVVQIASLILSKHREWNQVEHFQTGRIEIETASPLPIQLDGDHFAETPAVLECIPQALRVLSAPKNTAWFKELEAAAPAPALPQ